MIRQKFTPPTCTLEITANTSALSQWADQPVLKNLQFELHFDAPQLPEDMRVSVYGDRIQLEALYEAVTNYIQSFLLQSPEDSFLLLTNEKEYDVAQLNQGDNETLEKQPLMQPVSPEEVDAGLARSSNYSTNFSQSVPTTIQQPDSFPEREPTLVEAGSGRTLNHNDQDPQEADSAITYNHKADLAQPAPREFGAEGIYLEPKGALSHQLFLGTLANRQSGPVVNLGTLQLFDLATALEEYNAAVMTLPNLKPAVAVLKWPEWARTAAVVVLTAGLTAAVTTSLNRSPKQETASRQPVNTPAATLGARNNSQPQQIAIAPAPLPPPPPPPAAAEKLPKLPPMNGNPMQPLPGTLPTQGPVSNQNPAATSVNPNAAIQIPAPPNNTLPSIPPAPPVVNIPDIPPPAATTPSDIASNSGVASSRTTPREVGPSPQTKSTPQPKVDSVPPNTNPAASSPAPTATSPKTGELPPELPMVDLPENGPVAKVPTPTPAAKPENNQAGQPESSAVSDINVQIDQARDYFQQRWKPPASLTQPLEYTLALNADGSIRQVLPRGLTSGRMIDITGMPLANEPFVSPVTGGEPPRIRVVLRPDGRVQTFLEPFKNDF